MSLKTVKTETIAVIALSKPVHRYAGHQKIEASKPWVMPQHKMNAMKSQITKGKAMSLRFRTKMKSAVGIAMYAAQIVISLTMCSQPSKDDQFPQVHLAG